MCLNTREANQGKPRRRPPPPPPPSSGGFS